MSQLSWWWCHGWHRAMLGASLLSKADGSKVSTDELAGKVIGEWRRAGRGHGRSLLAAG